MDICICLPNLQLFTPGVIKLSGILFIGPSALSFSKARKGAVFEIPPPLPMAVPLWHNVLFGNHDGNTYYSQELVRKGVPTTARIDGEAGFIQSLPMLTKTVYRAVLKHIQKSKGTCFAPYHLP